MSLRDLSIRRSYDSALSNSDIVADFFDPVISEAVAYDRLAGYFNSGMLAACARGMGNFILNGGVMRIIASPQLSPADIEVLKGTSSYGQRMHVFEQSLHRGILSTRTLQNSIENDHIAAMAWLLKEKRLEIRIAVPNEGESPDSLFHHKVGIVSGNLSNERLSFSGSINETGAAWSKNFENFKVFKEWEESENEYFQDDLELFKSYWDGNESRATVISISDAIKEELLKIAPKEFQIRTIQPRDKKIEVHTKLRPYQLEAVSAWVKAGYKGTLAMATGTGKTKTAVGCFRELSNKTEKLVTIITSPYQHISIQWSKEFEQYRPLSLAGKSNWKKLLREQVNECRLGAKNQLVISVVQATAASDSFVEILEPLLEANFDFLFIGDEAHGLGARKMRKALSEAYKYRLGLSATPERYFDEPGTEFLEEYFGGDVFNFPIEEALRWRDESTGARALCDYNYYPLLVDLDSEEEERYKELTDSLAEAMRWNSEESSADSEERIQRILRERAMILKKAKSKIPALQNLIAQLGTIHQSLVYCVDSDQMTQAMDVLGAAGILYRRFTGAEGTVPSNEYGGLSQRASILQNLGEGRIDALVAMKCLDEGVDVPSAHTAIILASSGNPREFVQRRGRILRPDGPNKIANIYDFVVAPSIQKLNTEAAREVELKLFQTEMKRMTEFGVHARNNLEAESLLVRIHQSAIGVEAN